MTTDDSRRAVVRPTFASTLTGIKPMDLLPRVELTQEAIDSAWNSIPLEGSISTSAITNNGLRPENGEIERLISAALPGWNDFFSSRF